MFRQSNRNKKMNFFSYENMEKYTANYVDANHNFVIQNIKGEKCTGSKFFPMICVLKNILMRGCPTKMSTYLKTCSELQGCNDESLHLITKGLPDWEDVIKGSVENDYFPARTFYEELLPKYLPQYEFIQQLILPEASIEDITLVSNKDFVNEHVDFYLPHARLVIEIDGSQHRNDKLIAYKDAQRDDFLSSHSVKTIRIATEDIDACNGEFLEKIVEIEDRLKEFMEVLIPYKKAYEQGHLSNSLKATMKATAIMRFQITLLSLIEKGILSLEADEWKIGIFVREEEILGFENIAVEDLFRWIECLCCLMNIPYKKPRIDIIENDIQDLEHRDVIIDFSLLERWTCENEKNPSRIFVRTDYFDDYNYFCVSTADQIIKYNIKIPVEKHIHGAFEYLLLNLFGFDDFRPGQMQVVINALNGNDTVGLLPTGGGKSMIYQLVGMLQPCLTFVVAPIKSLMLDQRDNLDTLGIENTNFINSDISGEEKKKIQKEFSVGKYQFIWIAPERFQSIEFRNYLKEIGQTHILGLGVIDEVHCLSEWGHDFRTSYLGLANNIKRFCPKAVILGLTATASSFVLRDVVTEFNIDMRNVKTLPTYARPELTFSIMKVDDDSESRRQGLLKAINSFSKTTSNEGTILNNGIVFTLKKNGRDGCCKLSEYIYDKLEIPTRWYSGSKPKAAESWSENEFNKYKEKVQRDFKNDTFPLIVTTKAFGMGIDKANVDYTIHYGIPGSVEALYQEAGRAGRGESYRNGELKAKNCIMLSMESTYKEMVKDKSFAPQTVDELLEDPKVTVADIREILETYKEAYNMGGDIMGNLFFWQNNNEDVDTELERIMEFCNKYVVMNGKGRLYGKNILLNNKKGISKSELEKIVYKLSLLGVVESWLVEKWQANDPIIPVKYMTFDKGTLISNLASYIYRYDKELSLLDMNDVKEYLEDESIVGNDIIEFPMRKLLLWQFENISYNRRKSIGTLYKWCKELADNPEKFKRNVESYFRFDGGVEVLDYLAETPADVNSWMAIFFDEENKLVDQVEMDARAAALARYLESYKDNTAFNFINSIYTGIKGDLTRRENLSRLEMALDRIEKMDGYVVKTIIKEISQIKEQLTLESKEIISSMLLERFPENAAYIYYSLETQAAFECMMNGFKSRLSNVVGGLLNGHN